MCVWGTATHQLLMSNILAPAGASFRLSTRHMQRAFCHPAITCVIQHRCCWAPAQHSYTNSSRLHYLSSSAMFRRCHTCAVHAGSQLATHAKVLAHQNRGTVAALTHAHDQHVANNDCAVSCTVEGHMKATQYLLRQSPPWPQPLLWQQVPNLE